MKNSRDNADVFGLGAFRCFDDRKADGCAITHTASRIPLNRPVVYENLFAILTNNEAEALVAVEPLNRAVFHGCA